MCGSSLVGRGPFRVQRETGRRHGLGGKVELFRQSVVFVPPLELIGRIEPLGRRGHIAFKAAQRLLVLDRFFLAGGVVVVERQRVRVARMTNPDIAAIHVGGDGLADLALLPGAPAILAVFGKRETDIPFALVESPPRPPRVRDVVVRNARPRPVKVLRIELIRMIPFPFTDVVQVLLTVRVEEVPDESVTITICLLGRPLDLTLPGIAVLSERLAVEPCHRVDDLPAPGPVIFPEVDRAQLAIVVHVDDRGSVAFHLNI